jgi:hypothetical protein
MRRGINWKYEAPDPDFKHWPYACGHTAMEQFRGIEAGVQSAEGL